MRTLLLGCLLAGCATTATYHAKAESAGPIRAEASAAPGRLLRRTARLDLRTASPEDVGARATALATEAGGWLVQRENLRYVFRVPAPRFDAVFEAVAGMGAVLHRRVDAEDVTDEVEDLELRLRNARALRDRYRALLEQATEVKAVLEIEKELARLTETIERLEGRLKGRREEIAFVRFELRLFAVAADSARTRSPFPWLREIGVERLPTWRERYARSSRVDWQLPEDFADMGRVAGTSIRAWAYSPAGVRIVVRRFANRPRQSLAFWLAEANRELTESRGYRLVLRADARLHYRSLADGRKTWYEVTLVVTDRYVTTVEVAGPEDAVQPLGGEIAALVRSLR